MVADGGGRVRDLQYHSSLAGAGARSGGDFILLWGPPWLFTVCVNIFKYVLHFVKVINIGMDFDCTVKPRTSWLNVCSMFTYEIWKYEFPVESSNQLHSFWLTIFFRLQLHTKGCLQKETTTLINLVWGKLGIKHISHFPTLHFSNRDIFCFKIRFSGMKGTQIYS